MFKSLYSWLLKIKILEPNKVKLFLQTSNRESEEKIEVFLKNKEKDKELTIK